MAGNLGNTRIVGGSEAQVCHFFDVFYSAIAQENAYPWIAALVRDEDSNYVNTQCSGTLVCINW